jgi:hypothetical protein
MENELEINKARARIEEKMNELKVFDYNSLLIFASAAAIELQDKGLNWSFPKGFDYNNYAAKMLIKGAELAKSYHVKKANEKSHEETNQMKYEILSDYAVMKSEFSTKDDATNHYTKQYPLKFSTIRKYLKNQ